MSRIGKSPIPLPSGVTVSVDGAAVTVKGPKGQLELTKRPEVGVAVEGNEVVVTNERPASQRQARAFHGMTRALLANMVLGVTQGFTRKLEINGVGYSAKLQGNKIEFTLGFANNIIVDIPSTVTVEVPNATSVVVSGCDKQQVGQFASEVRKLRPPEPYKGKGIKYDDEIIRRKAGKAFGSA